MTEPTPPEAPARDRAIARHQERFGPPTLLTRAPGRVNLIGEHTDYNDGFVMPMALRFDTAIAVSLAPDADDSEIESEGYGGVRLGATAADDWAPHVRGMHRLLREQGIEPPHFRATVATDIPTGASLSSSAALEVAFGLVITQLAEADVSMTDLALLGQRVENEILGLPSGIMDQLISATAEDGSATLIDCRSLERRNAAVPDDAVVVVMDTGTRRQLVDSEFAARRATCEAAARLLGVDSLRDATDIDAIDAAHEVERRRARHVISENQRTLDAADALDRGDTAAFGGLMNASHASLRDDYEVSGPALDTIVEIAQGAPGCLGARMTGGGFAGCAVALVALDQRDAFEAAVQSGYDAASDGTATLWTCSPGPGASAEAL